VEDRTSQGTTHDLLLALAGRVDDDLLRWARELVALGEDARAVEMLTASLVAARAVLPAPVRSALVAAAHAARTDLGPAAALPQPRPEESTEHRFTTPGGNDPVAGALLEFPARPLTGCSVLLARRLTPAGTAPGPLPHPVVLVRVHDETRRADVLAYQLGAALERAGAPASVEVLPADGPVPNYHAAALDAAVELREDPADDRPWRPSPRPDEARNIPAAPPPPEPSLERHALAPPVAELPYRLAHEPHPFAPDRVPAPAPRHPDEPAGADAGERHLDLEPEPVDEAPDEDSAAATARMQPAGPPAPEGAESATVQLSAEPGLDADHRDEDEYDEQDEEQDDEGDLDDEYDDEYDEDEDADGHDEDGRDQDSHYDDQDDAPAAHAEERFPEPPSPHPLAAPRPLPARDDRPARLTPLPAPPPTPPPTPLPARGNRPRPTVTPISRAAMPNPIPLVRRGGSNPVARPMPFTDPRPALRRVDDERDDLEPPVEERTEQPQEPEPPRRETPAFDSLSDPLNGPLHQPLLAPLLDPTRPEDDPLGLQGRRRLPEPAAPPPPPPQDDEWSEDWLSGTWAMAPSALEEHPGARSEQEAEPEPESAEDAEPGRPSPRPVPRSPARHRFPDASAANGTPSRDLADGDDTGDEPAEEDGEDRSDLGLRPESVARLSDADRQLLARLQSELLEGRRQRVGRGITNGSHRGPPPDFAS